MDSLTTVSKEQKEKQKCLLLNLQTNSKPIAATFAGPINTLKKNRCKT